MAIGDAMGEPIHALGPAHGSTFESVDIRFNKLFMPAANLWRLHDRCQWAEGPVYLPTSKCLVWSDVPADRQLRWDETTGAVGVLRSPSRFANGSTLDRQGRLLTCEQGSRRLVRFGFDGQIEVLADRYDGRRLNSPNDVVVRSDGTIWFTDPAYGIDNDYEGHSAPREQNGCYVFRLDPATGRLSVVADDFVRPNGLAFSPDERWLYVADTGSTHVEDGPRWIRRFAVDDDGRLAGGAVFSVCSDGIYDGFRLDQDGRLWASARDGVHCIDPSGALLGKVRVPEIVSNVCFGGAARNWLFITATTSLYRVKLFVCGAKTV